MADLVIRISGDIKNYEEAMDKAAQETEGLNDTLSSVAAKSALAFAALTAEIGLSVAAYKESEEVVNKLNNALQNQGIFSEELSEAYQQQATDLQRLTGISDEAVVAAQATLQAYLGQIEVTPQLTQAIADLAEMKDMDLQATAELIGKGINGQTAALKKAGIAIDENATKQERLGEVIEKITGLYGGSAEAAAKGLGGLNLLKEAFGELQEAIGARFAPAIGSISRVIANFINVVADNKALMDFIASLLIAGTVVTGLVAATAAAGVAFIGLKAALAAAKVEIALSTIAVRGLVGATGLGLIIIALSYIALNWEKTWTVATAVFEAFVDNIKGALLGVGLVLAGVFTGNLSMVIEGGKKLKEAFVNGFNQAKTKINAFDDAEKEILEKQNKVQKDAAEARAKAEKDKEQLLVASRRATTQALILESQRASDEQIKLKREEAELLKQIAEEENAASKAAYQRKLEDNRVLQQQANETALEERRIYNDTLLVQNEEFEALSDEQKEVFRLKNEANLAAQVQTENETRMKAAQDRAAIQVKEHNEFLVNQQKFGTAYALINQIMNSTIVQGSAKAFGELAALQQSSNSTLKGIGKVAATATILIKTAESAMNIYAGFSTIPIVGPALGVAGAAAAVAFGGEQIGKVNAAAEGGLLEGGIPGVDSIPVLAQQGELITPRKNFDEVVDAVAAQRANEATGGQQGAIAAGPIEIVLSLKDNLMDFIEAQSNERQAVGVSLRIVQS